jgi:PAS domain S-box-containing protein
MDYNKLNKKQLIEELRILQQKNLHLEKTLAAQKNAENHTGIFESNLSAILENNSDGIVIIDTEGIVLYVNPAAVTLFGRSQKEFIGFPFGFPVSDDKKEMLLHIRKGQAVKEVELRIVKISWQSRAAYQLSVRDITPLRQAEEKLEKSEEKFRLITENSADAIFIADENGYYTYTNKKVTKMLGFSPKEMKRKSILDMAPKSRVDEYLEILKRLKRDGKIFTEIELLKNDGSFIYTDLNAVLLPNGMVYASCRDITNRKQAEKEIESLAKFPSENPNPVIRLTKNDVILYANEASNTLLKKWRCNVGDLAPEFWRNIIVKDFLNSPENNVEIKYGQQYYSFYVVPVISEGYVNLYAIDITRRKLGELELRKAFDKAEENEAKFRELFSNVNDAIFIFDPDNYDIIQANEATSAIYGYSYDELIGMSCLKFSAEVEKSKTVAKTIKDQEKVNVNFRHHKKKDGTDVFVKSELH